MAEIFIFLHLRQFQCPKVQILLIVRLLGKQHLPHGHADRLNPYSGKWNWHGDGLDADGYATEMLNKFEAAVNRLLAIKEEVA